MSSKKASLTGKSSNVSSSMRGASGVAAAAVNMKGVSGLAVNQDNLPMIILGGAAVALALKPALKVGMRAHAEAVKDIKVEDFQQAQVLKAMGAM